MKKLQKSFKVTGNKWRGFRKGLKIIGKAATRKRTWAAVALAEALLSSYCATKCYMGK